MCLLQIGVRRQQRGSYMIWMLILIPIIFGWLGLSIDAGFALSEKNRVQAAADFAALAAVLTLHNHRSYAEVEAAAVSALADNGFNGTVVVGNNVNHSPTSAQSAFFCTGCPGFNEKYVGVTVTTHSPLFINKWFSADGIALQAHAVARAEKAGASSSCPGIYANSLGKATNLLQGSDFTVQNGGIYIEVPEEESISLYGSSGGGGNPAVLSADWIEIMDGDDTTVGSVTFNPTPTDLSEDRETPDPAPIRGSDFNYNNCVLDTGVFKCGCKKSGSSYACPPGPGTNTTTLTAGNYIGGLTIINTPNVTLQPRGATPEQQAELDNLYFKMTYDCRKEGNKDIAKCSGDLELINSSVTGDNILIDARFDPAEHYPTITNPDKYPDLAISLNDKSVLDLTARLYANSFYLDKDSDIVISVYTGDQDGEGEYFVCGKKPLLFPTLLQ